MGAWSEDFFGNDEACDLSSKIIVAWIHDYDARVVLLHLLESAKEENNAQKINEKTRQYFKSLHAKLSFDKHLDKISAQKLISFSLQYHDHLSYILSQILEAKGDYTFSYCVEKDALQNLFNIMVSVVFHEDDYPALLTERLTPSGALTSAERMNDHWKIDLDLAHCEDASSEHLEFLFYGLGVIMSNLPANSLDKVEVFTPYFFKQFLLSSNEFLSYDGLATWKHKFKRTQTLSEELTKVIGDMSASPTHMAVLLAHYKAICTKHMAATEPRFIQHALYNEGKIPTKKEVYEQEKIQLYLSKPQLEQSVPYTVEKDKLGSGAKFKI